MEIPKRSFIQYLGASYEFALAIGNSLNLAEMLHEVIHTVVHKTNAHRGIIWVKDGEKELRPVASAGINIENIPAQDRIMDFQNVFNQILRRQQYLLRCKEDKDFLRYCSVLTGKEESVLIVPVENVALLHLIYAGREPVDKTLANLLASLSRKLSVAIEACTAHENIIKEIQVREKAEKELTKKTEQLISSQKLDYVTKDGKTIPVQTIVSPRFDEDGKFIGMVGMARDITERKQAEEALVQPEIKYRTLVEHLPAITYIAALDEFSTTLYISPQVEEILGISPADYKADPDFWEKNLHPDDRERVMDEVYRCHESGQPFISEYRMFSKDGRLVWLSDDAVTVRDDRGNPFHLQGVMYDITKRKQAENALQESERIWRDSFNSLEDVMLIIDRDYNIENINCSGLSLLGKSKKEVVGKKCYQIVHGVDSPGEYCPFRKVLKTKKVSSTDLYEDRFGKHFSIKSSPTFNEKGEIIKFVDLIRDITELKLAQEKREKMRTQLQQAQKMEAIGALAGGIAHDFNNILYPIIGYAELAMDHVSEGGVVQKNLHEILTAANRAKDLVQQILTFSRQGEHERKFIKTQPIIKEVLRLLRSSIPTSIKISQSIDKECGDILADPTQIYQVLTNLCTNAYHAMREKGGVLEVSLLEEEISPDDSKSNLDLFPGKYLKLTVSDTGHGMDQAVIKRIFDPYFTTKPFGEGTGLGLAITHGIVKSCGGSIQVYSKPDEGTTFHVYLPLIEKADHTQQSISTEPIRKGNESILLVDDEDQIVRMLQKTLKGLGYHVTPRTSSVEALEAFRAQPDKFDLVITDMTMPNMTGAELAPKLLDIRPDIPIILCTGFSEEINKEKAKAMGIREYILKPVVRDVIARTIRKVLDG